jgi:hypothetical protein
MAKDLTRIEPMSNWVTRTCRVAIAAAAIIAVVTGTAQADMVAASCPHSYPPQTLDMTQPINLGVLKRQLLHYACSGTYDGELTKVGGAAQAYLGNRAKEVSKPAIVLDIDETSLSNFPQMIADDFGFIQSGACDLLPKGPCGFHAWLLSTRATAIKPTLELFNAARANNIAVFFITGRFEGAEQRDATIKNLQNAGYAEWSGLMLRPREGTSSVTAYKSGERAKIAGQGYTIILNMGDQHSDLDGGFSERAYKLPNPFYFIP